MRKCYLAALLRSFLLVLCLSLISRLNGQVTVTIGAGSNTATTANGATTDAGPIYCTGNASAFVQSKHHMVYTATELTAATVPAGVLITKIAWNKSNAASFSNTTAAIFDIYLKNSSAIGVPGTVPQPFTTMTAGATKVYGSVTQTFPAAIGWVEFTLSTPFLYTGGALELTTNWDISAGGAAVTGAPDNFAWAKDPGSNVLSHAAAAQSPDFTFLRTSRAQIRFTYEPASPCPTPPTPGISTILPTTPICTGMSVQLGVSGNSLGTGQTYTWQSSSTLAGTYTDINAASSNPNFAVNPTVTTYYRLAVTCSGNTTYSTPVQAVVNPPFPGGTYTINKNETNPALIYPNGTVFTSIGSAVSALNCGIAGPVVFNVATGSGPYTEQVTIPQIGGTSAINTITFNGNGETLSFNSSNTNARAGILLNGADYIIVDSLNINGSAGTYAWGVVLTGQADNNIIRKCTITINQLASTSTNYIGVVLNGSATTTAVSGNNANNNLFEKNTILGGYYGYYVYGNSAAGGNNLNNKFVNSTIKDNYSYAIYVIYQSGLFISGNDISRPARTSTTTTAGVFLTTNCTNALIEKNRVHHMFSALATNTSTCYGIHIGGDATVGQENKVFNNLIYNLGGNGAVYGIYNTGGDNMQAYHNTIALDDNVATTGTAYGLYQTTAAVNNDFRNNVVSVTRSGTGIKRCIYFVTTTSTITCNNNILYMNASGGTNNHLGQFGTPTFTTLADWKGANSAAYDQQSISIDPQYASPSTGDYKPGNTLANNTGVNVNVTTDIFGNPRSTSTPDAGAYEFSFLVAGINMSAESLVTPAVSTSGCYTATETVTIKIRNNGSQLIDFAVNPVTVTVNVTGAATQTLTVVLNTGTLASDATMDVALPTQLNMTAPGVYIFNGFTTVTGDVNPADNAMPAAGERTKQVLNAGTATVTPDNICITQSSPPVLKTDGSQLGYSSLQWQQSTTSGTGFTDISGATTVPYTPALPIATNMYYRLVATCGTSTQTSPEVLLTVVNPQLLSNTPGSRCGPGTVTLNATASPGVDIKWYEAATGGVAVSTGSPFVTPQLTANKTYYVAAGIGGGSNSAGPVNPAAVSATGGGTAAAITTYHMAFEVLQPLTLTSVDIFPTATVGTAGAIEIQTSTNTVIANIPYTTTVTGGATAQTIMLNVILPPGLYKMGQNAAIALYRNTAGAVYPYTSPALNILSNNFDPVYYYYFYNWKYSSGCESPRIPVTATVNAAAALDVASDTTICNSAVTALTVVSNLSDYNSYIWSPSTELYTDAAATIAYTGGSATTLYIKSATPGKRKYYINAANSSTGCANLDSVTVTVLPSAIVIDATQTEICGGKTTKLSIAEGDYGSAIQWYSSADGVSYSPIAGATAITYTTQALSDTTWFKVEIKNGAGVVCLQPVIKINVNSPQILTTTPATRCSPGTVTLGATSTAGTTLRWYETASSLAPVGTGNSFVTPSLTSTTTYYVSAVSGGGTANVGLPAAITTTSGGVGTTNYGIVFDALSAFTLQTVTVYPVSATSAAGTVTIDVVDGTGAIVHTATVNVTGSPSGSVLPQTVTLNFNIQPGTNYKIRPGSFTGISSLLFEPSAGAPGGNYGYPFTVPGVVSIKTSTLTAPPTNTPRNDLYYYFYNWVVGSGCESARTAVTATIATPVLEVAQDSTVCNGAITPLTVTSNPANFDSYVWSPISGLYTDAAATIPYTGGTASVVYAKSTAAGKHKYYITASNSVTTCGNIDSVTLTVLPATLAITASRTQICNSGSTTLSIPAGEYGTGLQWYSSPDGTTYSPIAGATAISYTTPVITATTYYKLEIKNGAGAVCLQPAITVSIGNPLLTSTTPATRCGPGTLTLGAVASPAGSVVNWYTAATGGLPVATGTSFTTPVLNATTTYYATSAFGSTNVVAGRPAPTAATALGVAPRGIQFNATQAVRLVSVTVFSTAAAGGTGTVELHSSTGAVLAGPVNVSWGGGGSAASPVPYVLNLNIDVPVGTGHRLLLTNWAGGNITYETTGISGTWTNYTSPGGAIELTSSLTSLTATSLTAYYYFYNWMVSSGCESPRTAVTATVTPGPAFDVTADAVVCNNAIVPLNVTSPVGNFDSYIWSPVTDLYTDAAATIPYTGSSATSLYAKIGTAGIRKYEINATNTSCTGIDSVKLTVLPATLNIAATKTQICGSGTTTLSLPAGEYGNATFQWYTSPDGVAYAAITGATTNTYTTPNLTTNTYYKIEIKNSAGTLCVTPTITIAVGTPSMVSTAPATRCDPGTVTLGATPGPAGATVNWYAAATGGLPIATGNTFTTPSLASTTTYYAAASFGFSNAAAGRPAPVAATSLGVSPRGIQFNATQAVRLVSVTVFSTAAAGGTGTVELHSSTGAVLAGPVNVSWGGGGSAASPVPYVLNLNIDVPVGTGHRLLLTNWAGGNITYETTNISGTWTNYTSPGGAIELTASLTSLTATSLTAYYYFYNWNISTGCESPRTPVIATINGSIIIDADPIDKSLCTTGDPVVFSVTASGAITSYQWRKNGTDIPGATSAIYTINSVSAADAGDYDVTIAGPCSRDTSAIATLSISSPVAITLDPVAQQACTGGSVTFTTTATGTGPLGYQWRKGGVNIVGAYSPSLTINNITAADFGNYDVVVTGACTQATSVAVALTVAPVTTVATQPVAQTVCAGSNATFTAAGAGAGTLTYQWRKSGVNITGATSATFTIPGVTVSDAGNYDVVITGNCGSATSTIAGLTVNPATTITVQPLSQSICLGNNVTFSVTSAGAGTLTYQWRKGGVNITGATSSTFSIPSVTAADVANYDVVITASCGSVTSATANLLISAPGSWIGVMNADWNNAANWCGGIPTATTDVVVTSTAANMPILSNAGSARNITIQNGATVTVATGGTLNLYGNITGAGTFTPNAGSIAFRGATAQTVPAFTATNVIMNGTGGFTLSGNTVVTGQLTLTNGNITLGTNNLRLAGSSSGSASSHIVTNGSGSVIVAGLAASAIRTVPVGTSAASYTPVTLTANAGHVTDDLSVRVQPQVLANGTSGNAITRFVVDRTWLINETVAGGSNVNITLQWNESDELQDFGRNESYVMQYAGGAWVTGVESFATGTNPYSQTKSNVTSFAPLAVQTDPLPTTITGVFPNPVRTTLNVIVRTNAPEQLVMQVYDMSGKLIKTKAQPVGFGGTLLTIDVTELGQGTYILKVSIPRDKELLVRKFIKVN